MSHFVLEVLRNTLNSTRAVITNPKGVVYKIILEVNTIHIQIGATDQGCGEGAMTIEIFLIMFGDRMTVLVILFYIPLKTKPYAKFRHPYQKIY